MWSWLKDFGGMPAVVLAEEGLKREIILNYYNTLIRRDIIEKHKIRNEMVLKDLIKLLLNATHYTGSKLFRTLKSLDHSVGKEKANWFGHTIQVTMTPAWKFFINE
jgi:predicted AAA+ superfamily ATPase